MADKRNTDKERYVHLEGGIPIFSPVLEDPDPQKSADRESEKSFKDQNIKLQRRTFWTQVGLVVFGLIGIGLNSWQTTISQRQAASAEYSADISDRGVILAQKTERDSRVIAEKQILQSKEALNIARNQIIEDQRPWVFVNGNELSAEPKLPSDPVVITMSVFNSGKTPAIDVTVATHPCSSSKPCGSGLTVKGESPRGMIPPEENGFTVKSAPLYLTSSLSEYKNGKNFIYIESLIGYKDSFGESHWTTVCRYHQYGRPLIEFDLCPKGNDMDTEPYKRYPISASHPAEHSGR